MNYINIITKMNKRTKNIMKCFNLAGVTALALFSLVACGNDEPEPAPTPNPPTGGQTPENPDTPDVPSVEKVPTLLVKDGWTIDTVAPGLIYYNFEKFDDVSNAYQIVNVLELDLTNPKYELELRYTSNGIALSDAIKGTKTAIAGINAGHEPEAIYIKLNNYKASTVSLPPDHLRYWKHEGAIYWSTLNDLGICFPGKNGGDAIAAYNADKHRNLISSAPILLDNFEPCGTWFVNPALSMEDLYKLDYENPNRHQGVRHPRTVVALTEDRDLLLFTVDGRWPNRSEGMNAKELTNFLVKYFNPKDALTMDGGGSTTMVVKGRGDATTNVVNYPTDNGKFDHTGERRVTTHFLVKTK